MRQRTAIATAAIAATAALLAATLLWPQADLPAPPVPAASTAPEPAPPTASADTTPETITVHGRAAFFDPKERPASDITVYAVSDANGDPLETVTDDAGAFTFDLPAGVTCSLRADTPEGTAVRNAPAIPTKDGKEPVLEIVPTTGLIAGSVYTQDDAYWQDVVRRTATAATTEDIPDFKRMSGHRGTPLPGITVEAQSPNGRLHTTTDGQGRYRFANLPWQNYVVRVLPPDGRSADPRATSVKMKNGKARDDVDFHFPPDPVTIRGRVIDERGVPIADATLTAKWKTYNWTNEAAVSGSTDHEQVTESADDGTFAFTGLPPMHPKDAAEYLRMGGSRSIRIDAQAPGRAHAEVSVPPVHAGVRKAAMAYHAVHWREVGETGPIEYAAVLPEPRGTVIGGIEIILPAAASIVCTVVDTDGNPVPQADVHINTPGPPPGSGESRWSRSKPIDQPDGSKRFENLLAGEYTFSAYAAPRQAGPVTVTVAPGDNITDVVLVLEGPGTGTIEGIIYDADTRAPIIGEFHMGAADTMATIFQTESDFLQRSDVGYRMTNVPEGSQRTWISGGGHASHVEFVDVRAGETTRHDVYLHTGTSLTMRVTVDGKVAERCEYVVVQHVGTDTIQISSGGNVHGGATGERETFVVGRLEPGTHEVTIRAYQAGSGSLARTFNITTDGRQDQQLDIAIDGTAGVRGTIRGTGNGRIGDIRVIPEDRFDKANDFALTDTLSVAATYPRQPGNQFEAGHLEPGTYVVRVSFHDGEMTYHHQTVTLAEGEWADLTFDFSQP